MQFIEVAWQSADYQAEVRLRDTMLRKPLGLEFTPQHLANESSHLHFGMTDGGKLIACVVVVRLSETHAKLRQMAVARDQQRKGVGSELIRSTESQLRASGIETVELHAREPVIGFYESLEYEAVGEPFVEVTIRHQKMVKTLQS